MSGFYFILAHLDTIPFLNEKKYTAVIHRFCK